MIKENEIVIIKDILNKFIFKIKTGSVLLIVFNYYAQDYEQQNEGKRELNYNNLKLQIQRKILSQRNNYWDLAISSINLIEDKINDKNFNNLFKSYIENLLNEDINIQWEIIEKKEEEEKNIEEERIKKILYPKEDILIKPVLKIIGNNREFPYKSDKIKAFLSIKLNVEQILAILSNYENWIVPRGYIEKYRIERQDLLSEGKLKVISLEDSIKIILEK